MHAPNPNPSEPSCRLSARAAQGLNADSDPRLDPHADSLLDLNLDPLSRDAFMRDPLWDLLGKSPSAEPAPSFAEQVLAEARQASGDPTWVRRLWDLLMPKTGDSASVLARWAGWGIAATAAAFAVVVWTRSTEPPMHPETAVVTSPSPEVVMAPAERIAAEPVASSPAESNPVASGSSGASADDIRGTDLDAILDLDILLAKDTSDHWIAADMEDL